jgi:hypothetical protein
MAGQFCVLFSLTCSSGVAMLALFSVFSGIPTF